MTDDFDQLNSILQEVAAQEKETQAEGSKENSLFSKAIIYSLIVLIVGVSGFLFFQLNLADSHSDPTNQSLVDRLSDSSKKLSSVLRAVSGFYIPTEELPDQINVLVLGVPGPGHPGSQLTDSIVVLNLKPKEKSLTSVSLPRDFYVRVPGRSSSSKINSLYYLVGVDGVKTKLKDILGLEIDYHLIVNLDTVEEIIDLIDGLNLYVPQDIYDPYFPGPNYTYQTFSMDSGWRYFDGPTALKYMRTRYTSRHGDFDRMARQQQVLRAVKQKVFSLNPLWDFDKYLKIYDSLQSKIQTNLSVDEIKIFWQLAQDLDINKIKTTTIDREYTSLVTGSQVQFGEQTASVVIPQAGYENYKAIQQYVAELIAR